MPEKKIILASASPRRRELLGEMGIQFEIVAADIQELSEISSPRLTPVYLALENARRKGHAVASQRAGRWILGADTIVTMENRVIGKPKSLAEARSFLRILSGHVHEVITACVLISPKGKKHELYDVTKVTFRILTFDDIERYLAAVDVLDKAGAYALQEHGDWIIERVEGSRNNVIGLPTEKLAPHFQAAGLL